MGASVDVQLELSKDIWHPATIDRAPVPIKHHSNTRRERLTIPVAVRAVAVLQAKPTRSLLTVTVVDHRDLTPEMAAVLSDGPPPRDDVTDRRWWSDDLWIHIAGSGVTLGQFKDAAAVLIVRRTPSSR